MPGSWRDPRDLGDGRVIECIDVTYVDRTGNDWTLDVVFMLDGQVGTHRVIVRDWEEPANAD